MKVQKLFIFIYNFLALEIILLLFSCNPKTIDNSVKLNSLSLAVVGKLYFLAPELDSAKCQAIGACDCCAGNLLFLTDTTFVAADYCMYDDCYYKGTYVVIGNEILFQSDSLRVDKVTNEETERDTIKFDSTPFSIQTSKYKTFKFKWTKFECNGAIGFKSDIKEMPFATPDYEGKNNFIKSINKDSIEIKLGLNELKH